MEKERMLRASELLARMKAPMVGGDGKEEETKQGFTYYYGKCPVHGRYLRDVVGNGTSRHFAHRCPECERVRREKEAWGRSGIPARFQGKTFHSYVASTPEERAAKAAAEAYARTLEERLPKGDSLILYGAPGTGKTHLACAIGREAMRLGKSVLYATFDEIVRNIRSTWGGKGSEREELAKLTSVDLLIIDEAGGVDDAGTKRILFSVVNERYQSLRSIVLVTNANMEALRQATGDRCFSRLCEMARSVPFFWEGRRGNRVPSAVSPRGAEWR
ncbi:MAG: ATP-binding protein [Sutterellaceae bacterium]|nr:ATP-binding protein [Sutterellaceae bacterium]MDD7441748.1 ATP-binding protein [Sutterellaceae bacterium]MDY2868685.1 ATP-binding protein [Mesosutterella sp.]